MMKYLKLFETNNNRLSYENSENYIEPYVSYVDGGDVHYNKVETRLIATYNVENASNPTPLFIGAESMGFSASTIYDKIEIDNVEINISDLSSSDQEGITIYSYQLTSGEHTVKYTLKDPTIIGTEVDEETGIPKIGATFMSCPITSVEIPSSVTSIGGSAFGDCTGLTSVIIGNGVTTIGAMAFQNCSGLTSVTIGNNVISIDQQAFYYCVGLTEITIPDSVTNIGDSAFDNCSSLTSVTIGSGVTSIGVSAFSNCNHLTSITIPSNVTSIGHSAFYNCSSLISIAIPNSVTIINGSTFSGCSSLSSIIIPNSIISIGVQAFFDCIGLTEITIPSGVTSIDQEAFAWCSGLTNIISLATTAPTINSSTFRNVKTNGTLTVPSGSNGYDVWMGTGNYYLGKYNWTKVEQ